MVYANVAYILNFNCKLVDNKAFLIKVREIFLSIVGTFLRSDRMMTSKCYVALQKQSKQNCGIICVSTSTNFKQWFVTQYRMLVDPTPSSHTQPVSCTQHEGGMFEWTRWGRQRFCWLPCRFLASIS